MNLTDFLQLINKDKFHIGIIIDIDDVYYLLNQDDLDWLNRDTRIKNISPLPLDKQIAQIQSTPYQIIEMTSYYWEYDFLKIKVEG
jgi:hypothetical protein